MNKKISVRSCEEKDIPQALKLIKKLGLFWDRIDNIKIWKKKLKQNKNSVVLLEVDGKIAGVMMYVYDPHMSTIWHLGIDKKYQGLGLGKILEEEVRRRLKSEGAVAIGGWIFIDNQTSLNFFTKQGYEKLATTHFVTLKV